MGLAFMIKAYSSQDCRRIRILSIGLALYLEVNLPFLLCFTFYSRAIFQVQAPEGLIFREAI